MLYFIYNLKYGWFKKPSGYSKDIGLAGAFPEKIAKNVKEKDEQSLICIYPITERENDIMNRLKEISEENSNLIKLIESIYQLKKQTKESTC